MPRSMHGGRHELGQNFLTHTPTIRRMVAITATTRGAILEIGAGDGALTRPLSRLGRSLIAVDIDEHAVARLRRALPHVTIKHADAMRMSLDAPVIVGNIPFHLTTPILRRLLSAGTWTDAILLTQWEVARKRCGVGGSTMLTAQMGPWFTFTLHGRVPSFGFTPKPSVDGGIMHISRRREPLVPTSQRSAYQRFVRDVFTGRGGSLERIIARTTRTSPDVVRQVLKRNGTPARTLPRDLTAEEWAALWLSLGRGRR